MGKGMERAPERWVTSDGWTALALGIVLQAKRDVVYAAKEARRYLARGSTSAERKRAAFRMMRYEADSAVAFFSSPLWHTICGLTDSGTATLPPSFVRDMYWVRKALRSMQQDHEQKERIADARVRSR